MMHVAFANDVVVKHADRFVFVYLYLCFCICVFVFVFPVYGSNAEGVFELPQARREEPPDGSGTSSSPTSLSTSLSDIIFIKLQGAWVF